MPSPPFIRTTVSKSGRCLIFIYSTQMLTPSLDTRLFLCCFVGGIKAFWENYVDNDIFNI